MPQGTDEGLGPSTKLEQCPPEDGSGAKGLRVTVDPKQLHQAESSVGFTFDGQYFICSLPLRGPSQE